ncbi:MAG: DNA polymerase domain-containing protein [Nitrosopumilaceae archaeon]|nr:DNA polymerase domain-containing protein [Nitrosopumilaceae archaeon]
MSDRFYTYYKRRGNKILTRFIDENGDKKVYVVDDYCPTLYTPASGNDGGAFKSIYDEPLKEKSFNNMKDAANFGKEYASINGSNIHGNRIFENQFIIEAFEGQMPNYNPKLIDVGIFDIETDYDDFPDPQNPIYEIRQIDIRSSRYKKHYSFGLKGYKHNPKHEDIGDCDVTHMKFDREEDLLCSFIDHINDQKYDMISGWNSEQFDVPYLINRARKLLGSSKTNQLSPFGLIYEREVVNNFGNSFIKYEIVGLPHIDYMLAYQKHTYTPRERYSLDHIAWCELGRKKVDYSEVENLNELWKQNPQKYIEYNIQDCELIHMLDDELGLFDLIFTLAYVTLSNYEDSMGTIKIWEQMIAKHLYNSGKVPLYKPINTESREFEGAYVKPVRPGKFDWVVSFDLASLYPHLIQQVNIGPETIIPYHKLPDEVKSLITNRMVDKLLESKINTDVLKKYNLSMAANGAFYKTDKQSFLSELMEQVYSLRKQYKSKMKDAKKKVQAGKESGKDVSKYETQVVQYDNLQMGMKILLNSLYGAVGNKYFLYYLVDNAEAITTTGQLVNRWCGERVNSFLQTTFKSNDNFWIAGDTDSGYYSVAPLGNNMIKNGFTKDEVVDKIDKFCMLINNNLDEYCKELADYLNSYKQAMLWDREVIAESAIWVAKKRYTMMVWDDEGLRLKDEPKYKIMGMESVKSSTPQWSKDLLEECYKIALHSTEAELQDKVSEYEKKFYSMAIEDIAIPRGVNNIKKYSDEITIYKKGTPRHVKGVLVHNWLIDKDNHKINKIMKDGTKIKFISLKKPNPINQEVIAFDGAFPKEFGLEKYVNKRELFEKGFLDPLMLYLDVIGWSHEEINTLF